MRMMTGAHGQSPDNPLTEVRTGRGVNERGSREQCIAFCSDFVATSENENR